ncbi:MAG: Rrf2 family protein [bacterium]|jgi:Rrf2 family protein
MRDTKVSTAIHILMMLCHAKDKLLSSDYIASSVNTNPVVIRRLISELKSAGFVKVTNGKNGGYELAKQATEITVWDVIQAVQNNPMFCQNLNQPEEKCVVGAKINFCLEQLYDDVQKTLEDKLNRYTIAELYQKSIC